MDKPSLPPLWKDRDRYTVREAVRLWAYALAGVPLEQPFKSSERKDHRAEYRAAEDELRGHVPIQEEEYEATVQREVGGGNVHRYDVFSGRHSYPVKEKWTRQYFQGTDLAEYAKGRGYPGLFGFEDPEPPKKKRIEQPLVTPREETSVLEILGAILQAMYGDDILEDLTAPRSQRFKEVFEDVAGRTKVSEDTLRKYLKRIPR